jgi:cold shock CspA family protein
MSTSERCYTGTVKMWIEDKGFGFVSTHPRCQDLFINWRSLNDRKLTPRLQQGDRVQFDIIQTTQGLEAVNVVVISRTPVNDSPYAQESQR